MWQTPSGRNGPDQGRGGRILARLVVSASLLLLLGTALGAEAEEAPSAEALLGAVAQPQAQTQPQPRVQAPLSPTVPPAASPAGGFPAETLSWGLPSNALAAPVPLTIGSGAFGSVSQMAMAALCLHLNQSREAHGLLCRVDPGTEPVLTLGRLREQKLHFALVPADLAWAAYRGEGPFALDGPSKALRLVARLGQADLILLRRAGRGPGSLRALSVGSVLFPPVNAHEQLSRRLLETLLRAGLGTETRPDWREAEEADGMTRIIEALCSDKGEQRVDVVASAGFTPQALVEHLLVGCAVQPVPVRRDDVEQAALKGPRSSPVSVYEHRLLPAGTYPGQTRRWDVLSVPFWLVATSATHEAQVVHVLKTLVENVDSLRKLHPALKALSRASLSPEDAAPLPLHQGVRDSQGLHGTARSRQARDGHQGGEE